MFCENCGKQIADNVSFCAYCGSSVVKRNMNNSKVVNKNSKNKMIGLFVCIVVFAVVILGVLLGIRTATAGDYKKVAIKYAESYYIADYKGIKECLPYDVDEMFYDMFREICKGDDMTLEEGYAELEEEFDVRIKGANDLLPKYCEAYAREIEDGYDEYSIEADVEDVVELSHYEIEAVIEENNDYYEEWGVELDDYIDADKIKKGYSVTLSVIFDEGEDIYTEEMTYTVVKYKGKWKVLTIFDPDII